MHLTMGCDNWDVYVNYRSTEIYLSGRGTFPFFFEVYMSVGPKAMRRDQEVLSTYGA